MQMSGEFRKDSEPWRRWKTHSSSLLASFEQQTGRALLQSSGDPEQDAERLFSAPFVVVSHGAEDDPILNYGNRAALELWEMDAEQLSITPSRLTAEPMLREARERLLRNTAEQGHITGYEGVRISASGRRFRILGVTIWNVIDALGTPLGQAATFAHWRFLD